MDFIITVNEKDEPIGLEDKEKCHDGNGILHRAFLIMVFNERGELMLARRSAKKRLWPGFLDGTVASHPREGESYEVAAFRRVKKELGITPKMIRMLFKFRYQIPYIDVGSENEICAVMSCTYEGEPKADTVEVSEFLFKNFEDVISDFKKPEYTPWMKIALEKITREQIKV